MRNKGQNKKQRSPVAEKFIRFCASDFGKRVTDKETEYLRKELADRRRILDVGCGIGAFEERLAGLNGSILCP